MDFSMKNAWCQIQEYETKANPDKSPSPRNSPIKDENHKKEEDPNDYVESMLQKIPSPSSMHFNLAFGKKPEATPTQNNDQL